MSLLAQFRFPLLFLALYLMLQWGYQSAPDWLVRDVVVENATVIPSALLIDTLWPDMAVQARGTRLVSPHGSINVLRGCEGTEALLLLFAAILAVGRQWRVVITGLLLGTLLIYVVNQLRIVALYWTVVYHRSAFELAHGYIAPLFVIGLATLFFIFWLRISHRPMENG